MIRPFKDIDEWKDRPVTLPMVTSKKPRTKVYVYFGRANNKPRRSLKIYEELMSEHIEVIPLSKKR